MDTKLIPAFFYQTHHTEARLLLCTFNNGNALYPDILGYQHNLDTNFGLVPTRTVVDMSFKN